MAGAAFMTANDLFFSAAPGQSNAAGKLYAMDLIGSLAGALLTSAVVIPLNGDSEHAALDLGGQPGGFLHSPGLKKTDGCLARMNDKHFD